MRMDCGEAEADSVRPRAFFSLAMNLRKSNTRSSNGMTWGIFCRSNYKNINKPKNNKY